MYLRSKSSKSQEPHTHLANSYGQHHPAKTYSRKKKITPISSEADIRAAAAAHKPAEKMTSSKKTFGQSVNSAKHLISGSAAMMNSQIKIGLLSSSLDDKIYRRRRFIGFVAQVLLWAALVYVVLL